MRRKLKNQERSMKNLTIKTIFKVASLICTMLIAASIKPAANMTPALFKKTIHELFTGRTSLNKLFIPKTPLTREIQLDTTNTLKFSPLTEKNQDRTKEIELLNRTFQRNNYQLFDTPFAYINFIWISAQIISNNHSNFAGVMLYKHQPWKKRIYIAYLVSAPEYRYHKIGTQFINYVIRETDCRFIDLHSVPTARLFYRKLGFEEESKEDSSEKDSTSYFSKHIPPHKDMH